MMTTLQDPAFEARLRRTHRTATIIGTAVLSALAVTAIIEEVVRASCRPFTGFAAVENFVVLRYAFYAAAVAVVILLRVVHGGLLRRRSEEREAALRRLAQANVVTLALAEIPSVLGLALFLLGGFNRDFYVLLFVSLVLVFMYFPRRRTWERHLQDGRKACPF